MGESYTPVTASGKCASWGDRGNAPTWPPTVSPSSATVASDGFLEVAKDPSPTSPPRNTYPSPCGIRGGSRTGSCRGRPCRLLRDPSASLRDASRGLGGGAPRWSTPYSTHCQCPVPGVRRRDPSPLVMPSASPPAPSPPRRCHVWRSGGGESQGGGGPKAPASLETCPLPRLGSLPRRFALAGGGARGGG